MKRQYLHIFASLSLLAICMMSISCGKKDESTRSEKEAPERSVLMLYMIGSDLESRSGAATGDLEEILSSGIDLALNDVVIYTGGSEVWHNENVTAEANTILRMTADGFEVDTTFERASMGESSTFSDFLDYTYENYPADSYSLIMWNHGNGPVMGYGKDTLYDNDSLTLDEMKTALEVSPFVGDNKLSFAGFDACLMASAELACTFADHAEYLVASQEVEPSFGWNYSFLEDFGKVPVTEMLDRVVDDYMITCENYYAEKGYKNRDTTLSCMDLSHAAELEEAINVLFKRASDDIETQYNMMTAKRVNSRAVGRASTGSEYDLVDLYDLAKNLEVLYPEETKSLCSVLDGMIVKNGSNTDSLSGMSIFYPFYNKYHYEKSWGETYDTLDVIPEFHGYLDKYRAIWMDTDKVDKVASSIVPVETSPGKYKLELTPEQQDTFAEAKYYIFEKMNEGVYHQIYSSSDVEYRKGVLKANFDGNGIYVKNDYEEYFLPVLKELETSDGISRYSLRAVVTRGDDGKGMDSKGIDFMLSANTRTHEIDITAIKEAPTGDNAQEEVPEIRSGKLDDVDLSEWEALILMHAEYMNIIRDDNKNILPVEKWIFNDAVSALPFRIDEGIDIVYAPLDDGKYCMLFEITDTYGEKYCSGMLPINVESEGKTSYAAEEKNIEWTSGNRVEIYGSDEIKVYLKQYITGDLSCTYTLETENNSDKKLDIMLSNIIINNEIFTDKFISTVVDSKTTFATNDSLDLDLPAGLGDICDITSVSGILIIEEYSDDALIPGKKIERGRRINVNISGEALFDDPGKTWPKVFVEKPYLGALAQEQMLYSDDRLNIRLMGVGEWQNAYQKIIYCIENISEDEVTVDLDSMTINGFRGHGASEYTVPAKCRMYVPSSIYVYNDGYPSIVDSIETLTLNFKVIRGQGDFMQEADTRMAIPVKLSQHGKATPYTPDGKEIFNENGVRILLDKYIEEYGRPKWRVTVVNNNDYGIALLLTDPDNANIVGSGPGAGAHQTSFGNMSFNEVSESHRFRICILDHDGMEILFTDDDITTLKSDKPEVYTENITTVWKGTDDLKIYDRDGIELYLVKKVVDSYRVYHEGYDENKNFINPRKVEYTYPKFAIMAVNSGEYSKAEIEISDVVANNDIYCSTSATRCYADNDSEKAEIYMLPRFELLIPRLASMGNLSEITAFRGNVKIKSDKGYLLADFSVNVEIENEEDLRDLGKYYPAVEKLDPYKDASASKQVLYEDEDVRIWLDGFGKTDFNDERYDNYHGGLYCFENLTDKEMTFYYTGTALNGYTLRQGGEIVLPPKTKYFDEIMCGDPDNPALSSIENMALTFLFGEDSGKIQKFPVVLSENGKAPVPDDPGELILDAEGISIYFGEFEEVESYYGRGLKRKVTIVNDTDTDIFVKTASPDSGTFQSILYDGPSFSDAVYAHGKCMTVMDCSNAPETSFKIKISDFIDNSKIIYETDPITMYYKEETENAERHNDE